MTSSFGANAIIILYGIGALLITLYTIGQFHLLYFYLTPNRKGRKNPKLPDYKEEDLPRVTVQLPMYNEFYVAEAVIDACAQIDYPRDKFDIQVVDDSTDETIEVVRKRVEYWANKGIDITMVHRTNRQGFKAGALRDATPFSKGEFIAIFDADFRPHPDFLLKTIPYFENEKIGVVQGRWGHINKRYSMLTNAQSIFLDMFFIVEQKARALAGYYLRFNGSGGVWRKSCIEDAGGWSADTLSEDLDLCFRAQLKGWEIIYDAEVVAPAEIPVTMIDFKAQQYRWTKGKAQVIRKLTGKILGKKMPLMDKAHVLFDLFNIVVIPGILILAIFSVPLTQLISTQPEYQGMLLYFSFALINVILAPWLAWLVIRTYNTSTSTTIKDVIKSFPPFICVIIGIPLFQFVSMVDGFTSNKSFFHRTSKYNIVTKNDSWRNKVYSPKDVPLVTYFEGLLSLFFMYGIYVDFANNSYGFLPFHVVLTIGYAYVFFTSFKKG
tara:strand:- start:47414 stop:48895 length:1482 start_codon:yes stop_codon:yes gene_type:complete